MKKLLTITCGVLLLTVVSVSGDLLKASAQGLTCDASGQVVMPTGADLTAAQISAAIRASAWLKSMTSPRLLATTPSTITPLLPYDVNYTGAVNGSFNLSGVSYPVASATSIIVDSPTSIADDYRGVVTGRLRAPLPANPTTIQAYKFTDTDYIAPASTTVAADGTWTLNLSTVPSGQAGATRLGLIDSTTSTQVGAKWPQPVIYTNLVVRSYAHTDQSYLISEQPALANNTWSFTNTAVGYKGFRLVDTSTGDIIADTALSSGLIRSYNIAPGEPGYGTNFEDRSFVYDQAVALLAAIGTNDAAQARVLVTGLVKLQTAGGAHDGGFIFSAQQRGPALGDGIYRTGAHAIATDALLSYIARYPADPAIGTLRADAVRAMQFLQTVNAPAGDTTGLYYGGFGRYDANGVFIGDYSIPWASTEHNIDTWHTLVLAATVLNDPTYSTQASALKQAIATYLWSPALNRFYQGYEAGMGDQSDALDINSWGAIYAGATGDSTGAVSLLSNMSNFAFTRQSVSGYAPYVASRGYPGALPNVWFEGTFGVALGFLRNGQVENYIATLQSALPAQRPNGSFRYATDHDAAYELTTSESAASTAWYVLATTARTSLWNVCIYKPAPPTPVPAPIPSPSTNSNTTIKPAVPITPTGVPTASVVPRPVPLASSERQAEVVDSQTMDAPDDEAYSTRLTSAIRYSMAGLGTILAVVGLTVLIRKPAA